MKRTYRLAIFVMLLVILASCSTAQDPPPTKTSITSHGTPLVTTPTSVPTHHLLFGFSRPSWNQGEFGSAPEQQSFNDMVSQVNMNCVGVVVTQYLQYVGSTTIVAAAYTATDGDLLQEFAEIKQAGKCIFLLPHVDYLNDNAHWGTDVGDSFSDADWQTFQNNYTRMILHYAQICQLAGCYLLSIGNEFTQFSLRSAYWEQLIPQIRAVFSGKLTYSSWWDSEKNNITWWADVDYIGVNPWIPIANAGEVDPSLDEIQEHWNAYLPSIVALVNKFQKQVIFTEIGYASYEGMSAHPYSEPTASSIPDQNEQANAYKVLFQMVLGQTWLAGIILWYWPLLYQTQQYPQTDVSVNNKFAEQVIAKAFADLR